MDAADLMFAGPGRQAELVAAGEVTPRELVDACLQRIEELDPKLNAFRVVLADEARAAADALDGTDRADKPLFGVPVAIKDDQDVGGQATQFGTKVPQAAAVSDGEIVRRLRAAGAIVVGKTNVPELTIWPWTESVAEGITRNPWHPDRITGGSSGGSGAAVAAGMVGVATGSDGLGSIRIPAACCGVVGLKPQKDRVSIAPKTHENAWYGLAHFGVLTRAVRDTALVLDAIADRRPAEPFSAAAGRVPLKLRIAVSVKPPPLILTRADKEVRAAVDSVAGTLRALGHEVIERDPPYEAMQLFRGIGRWFRGVRDDANATGAPKRVERITRQMARIGAVTPQARVARSIADEPAHAQRWDDGFFREVDVLLTPVTSRPPFEAGRYSGANFPAAYNGASTFVPWTGYWNITGHPAISVPAGFSGEGTPIGVQLVTRSDEEGALLALAAQLEAERGWTDRRPPIS